MSDVQYPPPPPQTPPSQRFPSWKQALVMLFGGTALAISGCFGCLITVTSNGGRANASLEGVALLLAIVAFGGLIAAGVGVVFVLMRMLRALFAKKDETGSTGSTGSSGSPS